MMDRVLVTRGVCPRTCSTVDRQVDDFYVTPSDVTEYLLKYECFNENIWECAVGRGDMADVLINHGHNVYGTDIVDRGYPCVDIKDFLECTTPFDGDIITNPPYKLGKDFVLKALELTGGKVAMLFNIQFLESVGRYNDLFSKYPPKRVLVFAKRVGCLKNGELSHSRSAVCYAWFIWEKGYTGNTSLEWIDNVNN